MLPALEVIEPLMVRHGVKFAYLFGSQARHQAGPQSDVDIACWYEEKDCFQRFLQHCDLHGELKKLVNAPLDLIVLNDARPVLQGEAVLKGRLLYPLQPNEEVMRFEAHIRQRCEDYVYSQRFFTRALRRRLAAG
jgi:predicted nucleotidyltransferase